MDALTKSLLACGSAFLLAGCGEAENASSEAGRPNDRAAEHSDHDGHDHAESEHMGDDHHDMVSLGTAQIGDHAVELAQGHGAIAPGKELHLVVKLPYTDNGASVVRAWLGTDDRFASVVAKGEYAASHDDYDIHALAPDPLPENTMWWVEIEKPDGTKMLGSAKPL